MTKPVDKQWQGSIALSAALHLILIIVFLFGMPSVFETLPEEKDALTFEILPTSAITNVKNENKSKQQAKIAQKSREVKKSQPKPKPQPQPKPVEAPKKKVEKKAPEEVAKKAVSPPQEKKPIEKPKEQTKPIPQKDEDAIDAILKNLEKDSQGTDAKISTRSNEEQKAGNKYSRGMDYDEESPLSITERLLVKNQMQKHWQPPAGAQNIEEVRVLIHITIEKNGTIKSTTVKNIICPTNSETTCKLTAESAIRAIRKASPLENLLPERYDTWKEFNLLFDPSFLAQ